MLGVFGQWFSQILSFILLWISKPVLYIISAFLILIVLEVLLRKLRILKARSLFRIIPKILWYLAKGSTKIAQFLDKIIRDFVE